MHLLLILALLLRGGENPSIRNGEDLIRVMGTRYKDGWYRTLTFTQCTVHHLPDGSKRQETWFEVIKAPGNLRIDIAPLDSGNAMIFARDSLYIIRKGALATARPLVHSLLVLGFDVYVQPPSVTMDQLRTLGYNPDLFHETTWRGKPVYVVGAAKGDEKQKQFWIDKEQLLFVRSLDFNARDSSHTEVQFNQYERIGGGWVAPEVLFFRNGRVVTEEYYSDMKVNVDVDDRMFIPSWKGRAR